MSVPELRCDLLKFTMLCMRSAWYLRSHARRRAGQPTTCVRRRWTALEPPKVELAVKRIACSTALDVDYTWRELAVLRAAKSWDHCVGSRGCFWAPLEGKDGVRRGTKYYLAMPCALCPLYSLACLPAQTPSDAGWAGVGLYSAFIYLFVGVF